MKEKEIIEYKIVFGSTEVGESSLDWYKEKTMLDLKIEEAIKYGWQPYGFPINYREPVKYDEGLHFYQTMVKYKEDENVD